MKRKKIKILKSFRIAVQVLSCLYLMWWFVFDSEKVPSLIWKIIVCIAPIATLILTRFEEKMSKTIDSTDNSDSCSDSRHD